MPHRKPVCRRTKGAGWLQARSHRRGGARADGVAPRPFRVRVFPGRVRRWVGGTCLFGGLYAISRPTSPRREIVVFLKSRYRFSSRRRAETGRGLRDGDWVIIGGDITRCKWAAFPGSWRRVASRLLAAGRGRNARPTYYRCIFADVADVKSPIHTGGAICAAAEEEVYV